MVGSPGSVPGSLVLDAKNFAGPQSGDEPLGNLPPAFALLRGTWTALASESMPAQLSIVVNPKGAFTGRVRTAGGTIPIRGKLAFDGTAAISIPKRKLSIQLALDSDTHLLRAALHGETLIAEFLGHHALFTNARKPAVPFKPVPAEWTGRFAVELAGATAAGSNTLVVARSGMTRLVGRFGNGVPFTTAAPLSDAGLWPLYAILTGARGTLVGWVQLPQESDAQVQGDAVWFRSGDVQEGVEITAGIGIP